MRRGGLLSFDPSRTILLAMGEDLMRYAARVNNGLLPTSTLLVSQEELGEPLVVLLAVSLVKVVPTLYADPLDAVSFPLCVTGRGKGGPAGPALSELGPDASMANAFFVPA